MSVELTNWIKGLSREKLEKITQEAIEHMISVEDLNFYPYDDTLPNEPYWESCGIVIGEME